MPPAVAAGIGAVATIGSTVAGAVQGAQAGDAADAARKSAEQLEQERLNFARTEFEDLKKQIPSVQDRLYNLERLKSIPYPDPEVRDTILQEETELKKIQLDPRFKQAQMEVLSELEEISREGGITPIERAKLEKIQNDIQSQEKASREAILQRAAQMGTLSGGQQMAAQLLSQQGAADRMSQAGTDVASEAYKRALSAIEGRGELAGELRGQEYGEQKDTASAQDLINRINVAQRTDAQRENIAARSEARQSDWANKQRVQDINAQLSQEENRQGVRAKEGQYQDLYNVAAGKVSQVGGVMGQQASTAQQQAELAKQRADQANQGVISGVSKIGGGLVDYGIKNYQSSSQPSQPTQQPPANANQIGLPQMDTSGFSLTNEFDKKKKKKLNLFGQEE